MIENDMTMMAERVGQLTSENERLKSELAGAQKEAQTERRTQKISEAFKTGCQLLLIAVPLFGLLALCYKVTTASTKVDHCIVRGYDINRFELVGSLKWREDRWLGVFPTVDEALAAATKLKCEVK